MIQASRQRHIHRCNVYSGMPLPTFMRPNFIVFIEGGIEVPVNGEAADIAMICAL